VAPVRVALGARPAIGALLLLMTVGPAEALEQQPAEPPIRLSTTEEIAADLALLECEDESRYEAVSRLFGKAGALPEAAMDVSRRGARNFSVRKAGASPETIVIGAHYDKTPRGCGAVDNWTGIVAMAHLYSTLRDVLPAKSLLFVAFDAEEKGLVGSTAMVRGIPKQERAQYCAMINLDSFGLAAPQVLDNVSSSKLRKLVAELADSMDIPFDHARVDFADADSSAFRRRGIPAVTIHGLSSDAFSILHTDEDQPSRVNTTSVYLGYRLALALLTRLDAMPCDALR
jgi:hypothetical protein